MVALYQTFDYYSGGLRHSTSTVYIGVTPGSSHKLTNFVNGNPSMNGTHFGVQCGTHNMVWIGKSVPPLVYIDSLRYRISWSPEINTHTPDSTDY